MASLAQLKTRLGYIEEQINSAMQTAQKVSVNGSHSYEYQKIEELENQAARLRRQIYLYQGYTGRSFPNFGSRTETTYQ